MAKQLNVTDCNVEFLVLNCGFGEFDLYPHLEEFTIYENLFENHISSYISLIDGYNIPYKLPIVGEEVLTTNISLKGDGSDFTIVPPAFHVHSLSDRFFRNPQSQRFGLDMVSENYMHNLHSKVSKSYTDKTIAEIVEDIYENYLSESSYFNGEPTTKVEHIIIPNWRPFTAINWLAKRALSHKSMATNYVFYETIEDVFFTSIENLCNVEPVLTFVSAPAIDDPHKIEGLAGGIVKVDKMTIMNNFQKVRNINRGQYASKLITHDIVRKTINQHEYSLIDKWAAHKHCGDFLPLSDSELPISLNDRTSYAPPSGEPTTTGDFLSKTTDSAVHFYPKHENLYAKSTTHIYDNKVEDWFLQNKAQKAVYDNTTIQVECAGLSFVRLGMTVQLFVISPEKATPESANDELLSGMYLITAIKHAFAKVGAKVEYKMVIELSKDGLDDKIHSKHFEG